MKTKPKSVKEVKVIIRTNSKPKAVSKKKGDK